MAQAVRLAAVVSLALGGIAAIVMFGPDSGPRHPLLNEIVASNASTLSSADGEFSDWIEVHNPTEESFALTGWFLSDSDDDPDRWAFPEVVLAPDEHLVVFASGHDLTDPATELHTDFRIRRSGEPVLLVQPDGQTVADRLPAVALPRDASFGRAPVDRTRTCFFAFPTPGEENARGCFADADLGAPTFSAPSGFSDGPVTLAITAPEDAEIIYTLDGSYPDLATNPDRTLVYDAPLRIEDRSGEPNTISTVDTTVPTDQVAWDAPDPPELEGAVQKATVVRARTPSGAERVATYFVGEHLRRDGLPVLSLALDEEYLFDHDIGLAVAGRTFAEYRASDAFDPELGWGTPANYHERGRDWERPLPDDLRRSVVFEHCGADGTCDYQTRVGVRIHGNYSRSLPQKPLRLYARDEYGGRDLAYPFFADDAPADHRRLLLRNSGSDATELLLVDGYAQSLMRHFAAGTQAYQPAVLFINGEYWGIHNMRERQDRHYLETVYGADADEVVLFGPYLSIRSGVPAGAGPFVDLVERVAAGDPQDPALLARVDAELDRVNFFDFLIAHIYVGNPDWPGNNMRLWREPGGPDPVGEGVRDGRWRWLIFDLDQLGGGRGSYDVDFDAFAHGMRATDDPTVRFGVPLLFHRLMEVEEVRHQFLQRFADHLNTAFSPDHALRRISELEDLLEEEIAHHAARWDTPPSVVRWRNDLTRLRSFMRRRPDAQRRHLRELFDLEGTATVALRTDPEAGSIRVNSLDLVRDTPGVDDPADWEGVYFRGVPVELEAVPAQGYRFVRWRGMPGEDPREPSLEIMLEEDLGLEAVFAPA